MNVVFIYNYENEVWSTPLGLAQEFRRRGHNIHIVPIGSNKNQTYTDEYIKAWLESKESLQTDLVIYMDWGRFDSPLLDKKHLPNAFWIKECGDDPQNYDRHIKQVDKFDALFTPDYPSYLKYRMASHNCEWITHWADTSINYPSIVYVEYNATCSRGPGTPFLDKLSADTSIKFKNENGLLGRIHSVFLQSGLMVVQNSRWGEITRRIFEAMACGRMVLTDRLSSERNMDELFIENKHIVYYDSYDDCVDKIKHYTLNHQGRDLISFNGMQKTLANYTQKNVVDKLISMYNMRAGSMNV